MSSDRTCICDTSLPQWRAWTSQRKGAHRLPGTFLEGHTYTVVSYMNNHPMIITGHWRRPKVLTTASLRLKQYRDDVSQHNCLQQKGHPQHVLSALTSLAHRDGAKTNFEYNLIWSERPLHCLPFHVMEGEYQDVLCSLLPQVLIWCWALLPVSFTKIYIFRAICTMKGSKKQVLKIVDLTFFKTEGKKEQTIK